jgi:hypothetical protein
MVKVVRSKQACIELSLVPHSLSRGTILVSGSAVVPNEAASWEPIGSGNR